jgi:hypothetical protein
MMRLGYLLQIVGAGLIVVVMLTHVVETLQIFLWMGWGLLNSPGHYVGLGSAIAGPSNDALHRAYFGLK